MKWTKQQREEFKLFRQNLGRQLLTCRLEKGWTLADVEARTRIPSKILEKRELGQFDMRLWDVAHLAFLYEKQMHLTLV